MTKFKWSFVLFGSCLLATAAHAQPLLAAAESRDTGVGRIIAEQGNAALAAQREQFKHDIKADIQAQLEQVIDQQAALALASSSATVALNATAVH